MTTTRSLLILAGIVLLAVLCGCAERPDLAFPPPKPPTVQDTHTYAVLDWLLIPALLAVAVGVVMMIWLPIKTPGLGVAGGGAALAFSVLFFHALVSIMIWIVLGVMVLAIALLVYEFVKHRKALDALATGKPLVEQGKRVVSLVEKIRAKATSKAADALRSTLGTGV